MNEVQGPIRSPPLYDYMGWDRSTVHPSYILGMLRLPQW